MGADLPLLQPLVQQVQLVQEHAPQVRSSPTLCPFISSSYEVLSHHYPLPWCSQPHAPTAVGVMLGRALSVWATCLPTVLCP
jgi:hypothetical protein